MFEYKGQTFTLQQLQDHVKSNNLDFDAYMANMKGLGMVEKTSVQETEDVSAGEVIVNILKAIPKVAGSPYEKARLVNFLSNRIDNVPEGFMSQFYSAQQLATDLYTRDVDYDVSELDYLKTLDPNAAYKDPMGDPTGFKTNADKIKYLENYDKTPMALRRQKAEEKIIEVNDKLRCWFNSGCFWSWC